MMNDKRANTAEVSEDRYHKVVKLKEYGLTVHTELVNKTNPLCDEIVKQIVENWEVNHTKGIQS